MFIGNSKQLSPKPGANKAEYLIPDTAQLHGVCYDSSNHCVIVFDQTEQKLLWLHRTTGFIEQSVGFPIPTGHNMVDICTYNGMIYALTSHGSGKLSVLVGSIMDGKTAGIIQYSEHNVPYTGTAGTWSENNSETIPVKLKYNPKYCSITCKGNELYLLVGITNNENAFAPGDMGQYIFVYDISGTVNGHLKLNDSGQVRLSTYDLYTVNGLGVAFAYSDGGFVIIYSGHQETAELTGALKFVTCDGMNKGQVNTQVFFMGPFSVGTSICVAGRQIFYITDNKVTQAEYFMFNLWTAADECLSSSNTIDMGTIASEQSSVQKIFIQNVSYRYIYRDILLEVGNKNIYISNDPVDGYTYRIKLPVELAPGEQTFFYIKVVAPKITEAMDPVNYFDYLTIVAESRWV